MGRGSKSHIVYLIDFGICKKYWSSTKKSHIPFIKGKKLTGTLRYSSINTLCGKEQSRRDDLESVGYILIYFLKGKLPWQEVKISSKENRCEKIGEKKKSTSAKDLCVGLPKEFENFVAYTRNLEFTEVPDYNYLRGLLKNVLKNFGFTNDFYYDWCKQKPNIKSDDIIFTNDYKIEYNEKNDWLNRKKLNKKDIDYEESNGSKKSN